MINAIRGATSFFTTLKVGGDFESFRRNLWLIPFVGIFIGFIISIPKILNFPHNHFFCLIFYIAVEGIIHIDGLADFGDAFFAQKDRKKQALKDLKVGAGGTVFVLIYFVTLYTFFAHVDFIEIIFSQFLAKYCILLFLVFSKPAWEGLASELMKFSRRRDALIGLIPAVFFDKMYLLLIPLIVFTIINEYSKKHFGGVNGDVIGSSSCITFSASLISLSLL